MSEEKKKSWFRKHWFLTGIGLIILLLVIFAAVGNDNSTTDTFSKNSESQEKISGYSVNDCVDICEEAYDIQAQVDVCQGTCYTIGNPGSSMDKYVNRVKDIRDRN